MRMRWLMGCLLGLAGLAGGVHAGCVPVEIERGQPLPAVDGGQGPGCFRYQRVAAALDGASAQVLVFGDPQVKSPVDVTYFLRDIVQPLQGKHAD